MIELIQSKAETAIKKEDVKEIVDLATALRFGCIEQR
jgi:hypothetical protein